MASDLLKLRFVTELSTGPNVKSLKYLVSIAGLAGALTLSATATLTSDFKQVNEIEFSLAGAKVPDSGATAMLLGGALAGLGLVGLYLKR